MGMSLDADKTGDVYDRALMGVLLVAINITVAVIGLFGLLYSNDLRQGFGSYWRNIR